MNVLSSLNWVVPLAIVCIFCINDRDKQTKPQSVTYHVVYFKGQSKIIDDTCKLEIGDCQSIFFSIKKKQVEAKQEAVLSDIGRGNSVISLNTIKAFDYEGILPVDIYKNPCKKEVFFIEDVNGQRLGYQKKKNNYCEWELLKDTSTITKYICHKAQIRRDSLVVTAWFCNDLPIQEGPMSYYGLPGLIFKIESSKGWSINLIEIYFAENRNDRLINLLPFSLTTEEWMDSIKHKSTTFLEKTEKPAKHQGF